MTAFNLKNAIAEWKLSVQRHQGLEPGLIEELESNLYDRIEDYQENGLSEEEAFQKASKKAFPNAEVVADEYFKATVSATKKPSWKRKFDLIFLLPNYLKVAFRNFSRKKFYTSINYMGLVLGLLVSALAFLFIQYELSYDSFHTKADKTYRVARNLRSQDYSLYSFARYNSSTAEEQLNQINALREIEGVSEACHFHLVDSENFVEYENQQYVVKGILETNTLSSHFSIFDWEMIVQNGEWNEKQNYQAVLTASEAEKLLGEEWQNSKLSGKTIKVDDTVYSVTAVIQDLPKNSHYDFNLLLYKPQIEYWGARTYVVLNDGYKAAEVQANINANIASINSQMEDNELHGGDFLQPLTDIHLHSNLLYELKPPGDVRYLYIFGVIALIILLLTITNYTNLAIALNANRFREIGMRKTMGAGRTNIATQFLMESMILVLLSLPVVVLLLQITIPLFNNFMEINLQNEFVQSPGDVLMLIGFALAVGLISGAYPAFYLSSQGILKLFNKNSLSNKASKLTTRKMLITFQFILLIALVSLTIFINKQLNFIENKDLGYKKNGVMYMNVSLENHAEFERQMLQSPDIFEIGSGTPLGSNPYNQTTYKLAGKEEIFDDAYNLYMEASTIRAYEIKTSIDEQLSDKESVYPENAALINEYTAQRLMSMYNLEKSELIGLEIIQEPEYIDSDGNVGYPILIYGFFEDINVFSLREKMTPYFLNIYPQTFDELAIVSFNPTQLKAVLETTATIYEGLNEEYPLSYSFMDENLLELYKNEKRVGQLTILLSVLAFVLALFGLIALTSLLTALKKKEIGVRKILGASTTQIILSFNREYVRLIIIALLIASPFAYYAADQWLNNFAYKILIEPWIFVASAVVALAVAISAVSFITYRSAIENPVKSLKQDQ